VLLIVRLTSGARLIPCLCGIWYS